MRSFLVVALVCLAAPAGAQATNVQQLARSPASGASVNGAAGSSERQAEVRVQSVSDRSQDANALSRSWGSDPRATPGTTAAEQGAAASSGQTVEAGAAQGLPIILRGPSTAPGEVIRATSPAPIPGEAIRLRAPDTRDGTTTETTPMAQPETVSGRP